MSAESGIPKNLYFVQTGLPWNFAARSTQYTAMNEAVTTDTYSDAFKPVYEAMKSTMAQIDKRGIPEPLTHEEAATRLESRTRNVKVQSIMVAVMFLKLPKDTFVRIPEAKALMAIRERDMTAFRFEVDWTLDIKKGKKVAERIRATVAARDPSAVMMLYGIWETTVEMKKVKEVIPNGEVLQVSGGSSTSGK